MILQKMFLKRVLLSASIVAALVLSQVATADSRQHRRGYSDYGHGNHYRSSYRRHNSRNYYSSRYNPYYYGNRGGSFIGLSYANRYSRHGHRDSSSFVGGLVLGSLLSYPLYSSRRSYRAYDTVYRSRPVIRTREVVYANQSTPVANGRRLLRDLEGNCFERLIDEDGNEMRIQLDASECNF